MFNLSFNIEQTESSEYSMNHITSFSNPPETEWNQTYGGTDHDGAHSVVQTVDGGYALAGWTASFGAHNGDAWLVKVDSSGVFQWNRTYGGSGDDKAAQLVCTSDGGYALVGSTESFGAGCFDFWLIKVDSFGNHQWNRTYGGLGIDFAESIVETFDG